MTAIIGYVHGGKVYMGADGRSSGEHDYHSPRTAKIVRKGRAALDFHVGPPYTVEVLEAAPTFSMDGVRA